MPLQCEALSHRGVGQLLETIEDVRTFANADLEVLGVVATMYDGRTRHARHVLDEVESALRPGRLLDPPVPKSVRFAESPELGTLDPRSTRRTRPGPTPTASWPPRSGELLVRRVGVGARRRTGGRPGAAGRTAVPAKAAPDPLGRRALFWLPVAEGRGPVRPLEGQRPRRGGTRWASGPCSRTAPGPEAGGRRRAPRDRPRPDHGGRARPAAPSEPDRRARLPHLPAARGLLAAAGEVRPPHDLPGVPAAGVGRGHASAALTPVSIHHLIATLRLPGGLRLVVVESFGVPHPGRDGPDRRRHLRRGHPPPARSG